MWILDHILKQGEHQPNPTQLLTQILSAIGGSVLKLGLHLFIQELAMSQNSANYL